MNYNGMDSSASLMYFTNWKTVREAQSLFVGITPTLLTKYNEMFTKVKLTPCKLFGPMLLVGILNDALTRMKKKTLQIFSENLPDLTIKKDGIDKTNALFSIQKMLEKVMQSINGGMTVVASTHLKVFESSQAQDILQLMFRKIARASYEKEKLQDIAKMFDLKISVFYGPQRVFLEATSARPDKHLAFIVFNSNRFFLAEPIEVPEISYVPQNNIDSQYASVVSKKPGIPAGHLTQDQTLATPGKSEQSVKQRLLDQQQKQIISQQLQNQAGKQLDIYPDMSNANRQVPKQQEQPSNTNSLIAQKNKYLQERQEADKMSQSANMNSSKKAQYPDLSQSTGKNTDINNLEKSQQLKKPQIAPGTSSQGSYQQPEYQTNPRAQPSQQQQQQSPSKGKPSQPSQETEQDKNNNNTNGSQNFCSRCKSQLSPLYTNPSCNHQYCFNCLTEVYIEDSAFVPCFRKYCAGRVDTQAIQNFVLDVIQKKTSPQQSFKIECAYCNQSSSIEIDTKPEYYKCPACSRISCLLHVTPQQLEKCFCKCPKCLSEAVQVGKMKQCPRCKISKCTKCQKSYPQMEDCRCKCEFCQREQSKEGSCCPCTKDMCSCCLVSFDLDTIFKPNPNCKLHFLCNPCYFAAMTAKTDKQKKGIGEQGCVFCQPG